MRKHWHLEVQYHIYVRRYLYTWCSFATTARDSGSLALERLFHFLGEKVARVFFVSKQTKPSTNNNSKYTHRKEKKRETT